MEVTWPWLAAFFVGGLIFGSFANVVIYRVPNNKSIVSPGSSCPECGRALTWFENVPLLSYALQRGQCRGCAAPISSRYPLVELLTGALWVLMTSRFGLSAALPAYLVLCTVLVILSAIDLEHRRIPNRILGPAALAGVVLLVAAALAQGEPYRIWKALAGGAAFGLPMLALAFAVPSGMGMGDVKLAGYLGLHLGWIGIGHVAVGAFLGFFLGAFTGVALILVGRKGRKSTLPFGPAMSGGALVAVCCGQFLLDLWLG